MVCFLLLTSLIAAIVVLFDSINSYRELAQFYPWELVNAGAIRHCVTLLKLGDVALQTIVYVTKIVR